ncbi:PREDICTED: RNA-binding protein 34 isoform X2 [Gavialis gangeticus]|uniref:RNA-binding protein 34 isoform X2 n=1 Tax=Gavialis gangeticus TaxID=94835 RepID=UPI00092EF49B|nr:PREDICTED: RNA-binding protein 34 isoform X2 [Gavialis gangeticus]
MKAPRTGKASRAAGKEGKRPEAPASPEDYVVGQVANSLLPKKPAAGGAEPLSRLFAAPEIKPVFVTVPRENKKRKHAEVERATKDQSSFTKQESHVKLKKPKKKELSIAEKKVANRECALEQADEEEEKQIHSKKKLKNQNPDAITQSLDSSEKEAGVKQHKKKQISQAEMLKNKRTVFVGNLPIHCTTQVPAEDTLSKKLAAIKRKLHPNMKYVNAYVVFKEECAANKALTKNGTQIAKGFHIRVDLASAASSHDNKRSIFLGNLSYDVEDDAVRDHFSECGNVVAVRIVRDRNTGIGKGFGYVLFENTDAVHLALKLNNSELKGRKLRVKRCDEKEKVQRKNSDSVKNFPELKHKSGATLKNAKSYSNNSFAGEKASPIQKNKRKRPKSVTQRKTGKHK